LKGHGFSRAATTPNEHPALAAEGISAKSYHPERSEVEGPAVVFASLWRNFKEDPMRKLTVRNFSVIKDAELEFDLITANTRHLARRTV